MKIKYIILLMVFGMFAVNVNAQIGVEFPSLDGVLIEGGEINIPNSTQGKPTIIGMAYSKKSEEMLQTWFQPIYNKFILKQGMFDDYDVNVFFIPMFTGRKEMAFDKSLKKLRSNSSKDLHPYVLFYKGGLSPYVEVLKMQKKDIPYFFVLDSKGEIIFTGQGYFKESKMEEIEEALDNL